MDTGPLPKKKRSPGQQPRSSSRNVGAGLAPALGRHPPWGGAGTLRFSSVLVRYFSFGKAFIDNAALDQKAQEL